ncbi:MAG: TonB-dependent receptor [Acidobacteria bacterium]|nr:TonB-dependent receptor [Acidobacteriota bacterium]
MEIRVNMRPEDGMRFTRTDGGYMWPLERFTLLICTVVALLQCFALPARSQTSLGAIQGTVQDTSAAVIPGAEIVATHLSTNVSTRTESTSAGAYLISGLPVGSYEVTANLSGFKKLSHQPIVVSTGTTVTVNITLQVGPVTEVVEVRGAGPSLNTTSAELGTVMEGKLLLDLPLSMSSFSASALGSGPRQMEEFIFLAPGVSGNMWSKSVNGSPDFSQEILIDGASAMDSETPGRSDKIAPPYEAVEEFKVHTANYSAEFGRGFGVMNFTLKSGTNAFHGDVFEFLRNDVLDARGFFATAKPRKRQNEFGGTFGGPIVLPRVYNGKNKSFFFFAYTGFRVRGVPANLRIFTIPTPRQRQGDFGEYLDSFNTPIFDPATTRPDGRGGFVRNAFPGNVIPKQRWSRIATQANEMWPSPHFPTVTINYVSNEIERADRNNYSLKFDHAVNARHKVFYSMFWGNSRGIAMEGVDGPWNPGFTGGFLSHTFRLGHNAILRPNLLNDFVAGLTRSDGGRVPVESSARDPFNIPGLAPGVKSFPTFTFAGYRHMGNSSTQPSTRADNNINIKDTLTYLRANHQVKAGFAYLGWRANQLETIVEGGWFYHGRGQTSQPNSPDFARWGNSYASFLLGQPFRWTRLVGGYRNGSRVKSFSWFVEDSWKLGRGLTLSLGVRHEVPLILTEAHDRMSMFSPSARNPATGLPGALIFAGPGQGRTGSSRFAENRPLRHFAPRASMAWQVDSKTVVRTGYGIMYAPGNASTIGRFTNLFKQGFVFQDSGDSLDGFSAARHLDDGFPAFNQPLPFLDPTLVNNRDVDHMNQAAGIMPDQQQWNFSVQRELRGQIVADLGYVGTKGTHLAWGGENLNQLHPRYLSLGPLLEANIASAQARAGGIPVPYTGFQGTVAQALRPFPHIRTINNYMQPTGNSSYHSMQLKLQRRFAQGYHFLVSYTLSKAMAPQGATTGLSDSAFGAGVVRDTYNQRLDKSISPNDQTHNIVFAGSYELPLGKGKRLLSSTGAAHKLAGGWVATFISRYATGFPLSIGGGSQLNLFNGGNRPNRVPNVPMQVPFQDPAKDLYLNAAAFSNPLPYTFGTLGEVISQIRGFPLLNEDIALLKRTAVSERVSLEFRTEFFNIFNRTRFRDPNTDFNNPSQFGRVAGQVNFPRSIQFALKLVF